jgi:RNA polymerase sigma factor (TIGR02999 family)
MTLEDAGAADLLRRCSTGDVAAYDALFAAIYDDLRRRARRLSHAAGATLSTTALVHETYLRLAGAELSLNDRAHFFALAARVMRQVLINAARERGAQKRGGDCMVVALDSEPAATDAPVADLLGLDQALERLAAVDTRLVQVVELHFFAGLGFAEIGTLLGVSERTVSRDWRAARALLRQHLEAAGHG